ncbi:MAG: oligopeptide/dipeptide ABC transporter ATP-binding protein [Thermoplasmatota archaeon]
MANKNLIEVENLKKYFELPSGTVKAINGIDFKIKSQEVLGLVGESGSGKSTTGKTLMGIHTPTEGKITFKGRDISISSSDRSKALKRDMNMVFQDPGGSLNPTKTVLDIVSLPLKIHDMVDNQKEAVEKVYKLLETVDLEPERFIYRRPADLGQGEKQAVAIARAIATDPSFVVLDEPTSALDVSIQAKIMNILIDLQKQYDMTYLFITHDLGLMRNIATRVVIMYLGQFYELAPTHRFFEEPLHPYTKVLLSSFPTTTEEEEKLKPNIKAKGEIPSAIDPPSGCRFHTRCPYSEKKCEEEHPELVEVRKNHYVACHKIE